MSRPLVLVTNDDGIESYFLEALVMALAARFTVRVVAPRREQSWTGRAFSRRAPVKVEPYDRLGVPAWAADGTPSDCANIGIGPFFADPPAAVVSGINLGFNVTLPLILSSGTVAAATEGALAGLPALAVSQAIPSPMFEAVRIAGGRGDPAIEAVVRVSAEHAADLTERLVAEGPPDRPIVHNVNFPFEVKPDTPIERTRIASVRFGGVFAPGEDGAHRFGFPSRIEQIDVPPDSDRACLARGHISHTVLDYSTWGALG